MARTIDGPLRVSMEAHLEQLGRTMDEVAEASAKAQLAADAFREKWDTVREEYEQVKFILFGSRMHAPYLERP